MNPDLLRHLTWQDLDEIVAEYDAVTRESRTLAYDQITWYRGDDESIYKEVLDRLRKKHKCLPPIGERYDTVLAAAQVAVGRQITAERNAENTLIRSLVAYRLHNDGYSYHEIGGYMHRDHSTVTHLYFKMRDMLSVPEAYKAEMKVYERFEGLCG
jgi:hypothetical protein